MSNQQDIKYADILGCETYRQYQNGDLYSGIDLFSKVVLKKPNDSNIWIELGNAHLKNKDYEMSKICFDTAIDLSPDNPNAICAIGLYYFELGLFKEAKMFFLKTLKICPDSEWGLLNLSLTEQKLGNVLEGLELYEKREKERSLLLHENLKLKKLKELSSLNNLNKESEILIIGEQGFGDQLMVCLYIKKLASLGFRISYLVNEKLYDLLIKVDDLKNIHIIHEMQEKDSKKFDYKIFSMSLPLLFTRKGLDREAVKICTDKRSDKLKMNRILDKLSDQKIKVGIAWSGRPTQIRNSFRSIDDITLEKIISNNKINFFSLQKLPADFDKNIFTKYKNFHNCEKYLNNFEDTSAWISRMDIIISVCTSLAHLSGLMAKKTLLLLSYVHDPRWDEEFNGCLYPSLKIIKQQKINEWEDCLDKIQNELLNHNYRRKNVKKSI